MTKITIVDKDDNVIDSEERDIARAKGLRHRIVRVFVLNDKGMVLLHQRSSVVQDTPNKWDQSAGGHVDEGEDYLTAAQRETREELGIDIDEFVSLGKFYIERPVPGGIVRRFQIVFKCRWDGEVIFDQGEITQVRWLSMNKIDAWLESRPDDFTNNFAAAFSLLKQNALPWQN